MYRKSLTDGTPRWFDADKADHLGKVERADGYEEHVWCTRSGLYIIEKLTHDQALDETRECLEITPVEAATWCNNNGIELPEWLEHHLDEI